MNTVNSVNNHLTDILIPCLSTHNEETAFFSSMSRLSTCGPISRLVVRPTITKQEYSLFHGRLTQLSFMFRADIIPKKTPEPSMLDSSLCVHMMCQ